MTNRSMIRLASPNAKSEDLVFYWQQNAKVATEENKYILNTIHWVIQDVEELSADKELLPAFYRIDIKSYSSVKEFTDLFNRKLISLKDEWSKTKMVPAFLNRRANKQQLHHIIDYCYSKAVEEPDKLNQYVPFSAEVYGETSFELVDQIIEWVQFRPDDVFIDLGSGVGQVVLQVAAATNCRSCCGIEKAEYPARCAITLDQEFRRLMNYFGKPFNPFTLTKGDFLGDEFQDTISNSTVIFANNFAFGPVVDHQLKNRFTSLKEGAKIISSKAFCPLKFRITDRNLDDVGSILRVKCLNAMENAVSWTCTAFSYYLHQVDYSMLEDYFAKYKQNRQKLSTVNNSSTNASSENESNNGSKGKATKHIETTSSGGSSTSSECNHKVSQSLNRSLQPHNERVAESPENGRSRRLSKSLDSSSSGKKESLSRRASERLLRNTKKRPLFARGISEDERRAPRKGLTGGGHQHHAAPVRKRGRVRKADSFQSGDENRQPGGNSDAVNIELLFQSTLANMDGQRPSANGVDMGRYLSHYVPRMFDNLGETLRFAEEAGDDINTGQMDVVPVAVLQYLEVVKHQLMKQISTMRRPEYRNYLLSEIDNQRSIRDQLNSRVRDLEAQIPKLHREGVTLLTNHLRRLGISADSPSGFFSEARKLIKEQASVEADNGRLKTEISDLLTSQRELRELIRQQEVRRQEALMALRSTQVLEQLIMQQQQQQQFPPEYASIYSPISKASSPDLPSSASIPSASATGSDPSVIY